MKQVSPVVVVAWMVLAAAGCGQSGRVDVSGKVFLGDQPAARGAKVAGFVTFHPDESQGNKSGHIPTCEIREDGTYVMMTNAMTGVEPGVYKVGVQLAAVVDLNNPYVTNWLMPEPEKYSDPQKSGITIEVRSDAPPGAYDIKLPAMPAGGATGSGN